MPRVLFEIHARDRLILPIAFLFVAVLPRLDEMNEWGFRGKLLGVLRRECRLLRLAQVLNAELLRGLPERQFKLAAKRIDNSLVILGDGKRPDIKLGKRERRPPAGLDKNAGRPECPPIKVKLVDLRIKIAPRQLDRSAFRTFPEILFYRVVILECVGGIKGKPRRLHRGHPRELPVGKDHVRADRGPVKKHVLPGRRRG